METLTTIEKQTINGGIGSILGYLDHMFVFPPDGPVYADGTGSGYAGEIWFP